MELVFPINYFINIFSPIKIFKNRKVLKIWQIGLIVLLLNALMLIPLSFQIGNMQTANLEDFVPKALSKIDDQFLREYNQSIQNGNLVISENKVPNFYTSLDEAKKVSIKDSDILIASNGFIIKEKDKPLIEQTFAPSSEFNQVETKEELVKNLSQHWFDSNRMAIVLTNFINIWILLITNFTGLLLGTGFILWLTHFAKIFTIETFNEALQLSLNAFGLPTLIAMLIGLLAKEPNSMALIQSSSYILWLLFVFWKTHFNDRYLDKRHNS